MIKVSLVVVLILSGLFAVSTPLEAHAIEVHGNENQHVWVVLSALRPAVVGNPRGQSRAGTNTSQSNGVQARMSILNSNGTETHSFWENARRTAANREARLPANTTVQTVEVRGATRNGTVRGQGERRVVGNSTQWNDRITAQRVW